MLDLDTLASFSKSLSKAEISDLLDILSDLDKDGEIELETAKS